MTEQRTSKPRNNEVGEAFTFSVQSNSNVIWARSSVAGERFFRSLVATLGPLQPEPARLRRRGRSGSISSGRLTAMAPPATSVCKLALAGFLLPAAGCSDEPDPTDQVARTQSLVVAVGPAKVYLDVTRQAGSRIKTRVGRFTGKHAVRRAGDRPSADPDLAGTLQDAHDPAGSHAFRAEDSARLDTRTAFDHAGHSPG